MPTGLLSLPLEMHQELSLHFASLQDVLSLEQTCTQLRAATQAPWLFRQRVTLRGWDVDGWDETCSRLHTESPQISILRLWKKIDYLHEKFEHRSSDISRYPKLLEELEEKNMNRRVSVPNAVEWAVEVIDLLSIILVHHRNHNAPRVILHSAQTLSVALRLIDRAASLPFISCTDPVPDYLPSQTWLEAATVAKIVIELHPYALLHRGNSNDNILRAAYSIAFTLHTQDSSVLQLLFPEVLVAAVVNHAGFGDTTCVSLDELNLFSCPAQIFRQLALARDEDYADNFAGLLSVLALTYGVLIATLRINIRTPQLQAFITQTPLLSHVGNNRMMLPNDLVKSGLHPLRQSNIVTKWVGYYSYPARTRLALGSPMQITFNSDITSILDGRGQDSVGQFTLALHVHQTTGIIRGAKSYLNGPIWTWYGILLPWGMAGVWGDERTGWGHYWWIWPIEA
ncbi:hypothetical protein K474DRAFT_1710281 [Panus rudis PR-1116 ss-1]|nr:hypothetical protein K474DRAFT_1710281 [Panus rudis PR-1116 ss-1]